MDSDPTGSTALLIARAFVSARTRAVPLAEFPGPLPWDMAAGYAIQEAAIALWPDEIAGWKVGLVPPSEQPGLGTARLAGPIFLKSLAMAAPGATPALPAIAGGFAAIEVELVAAVGKHAEPGKTQWTAGEAATLVEAWHLGVEFAASPLATINDLGAPVVASDFGNNSGLVVGPRLDEALVADPARIRCQAIIDGRQVGYANAEFPGGPLEALRFLAGHLAERRRPLRAGQWVSTGAITGVHRVRSGQVASAEIIGTARVEVSVVSATSRGAPPSLER